jgi:membrane dipeptidase
VSLDPITVHHEALVIDTHADTPQRFLDEGWHFSDPLGHGMLSLDTAAAGGLNAEFFAAWVEPRLYPGQYASRTFALLQAVHEQVRRHADRMRLCLTPDDILAAHAEHKFAALLGVEGGHSIENSLDNLRAFHALGARYMTLTWSNTNEWADSSGDQNDPSVQHHGGLTAFGRDVVREMNRLGMMVDVSHVSDQTFADVLAVTTAPVITSHSSSRALTSAPRNLTDDMLRAIAANNGAVMVNFFPAFISETWRTAWNALLPELHEAQHALQEQLHAQGKSVSYAQAAAIDRQFAARIPRAPFTALIDHIDHVAKTAGIDHVGIGTDFDGMPSLPEGIDSAADLPKITAALMARGYTAEQMQKLLGGNLLRVFRDVQRLAVAS